MARPGKEQTFFFASIGLTGLLATLLLTEEFKTLPIPAGKAFNRDLLDARGVPTAPRGALHDRSFARDGREAFREPRDWLPLPAVNLERPPLRDPAYVPPPTLPAASLSRLGIYRQATNVTAHEFAGEGANAAGDGAAEEEARAPASAAAASAAPGANSSAANGAASGSRSPSASGAGQGGAPLLSRDEEFQKKYDWLDLALDAKPWYVVIKNADKFGLLDGTATEIEFTRINPVTGRVMIGGKLPFERLKPGGIHFAETPFNRAELKLREVRESQWGPTTLPHLLDAAAAAIALGIGDPACYRSAIARLEKWLTIDLKQARTYELLADAKAALLDFEGELLMLRRAEAAGVEGAGLAVRHARWLARVGARAGALARLAATVQRFPTDRDAHLAYGRALLDEGSPASVDLAVQRFAQAEQASNSMEQRIEVIAETVSALLERGDAARALDESKRILKIDPQSVVGLRLQGATEFALGLLTEAEADFGRMAGAARNVGEEGEALLSLGVVRTRIGTFDLARDDLARAPQRDPLLAGAAAVAEAELLAVTGHLDQAVTRARDAFARAPDDAFVGYFLGRLLRQSGDLEGARAELRRALDLGAGFPDLFNELGFVALSQGVADDARRYFIESLAREERDETRLLLAHAHLLAGDLARARSLFEQLQSKKTTSESLLGQAFCAYRSGDSATAQQGWLQVRDELKGAPTEDVAYATKWLAAVQDLESKQVWDDALQWSEVGNGWDATTSFGPELKSTPPGNVRISGTQKAPADVGNWTILKREVELSLYHEFEVECSFAPEHKGRMGMGLVHYQPGAAGQPPRVRAALTIALDVDGTVWLQRCEHPGDEEFKKIGTHTVKPGDTARITLRRSERGNEKFQFLLDGAPITEVVEMAPWKGRTRQGVAALFFGSAPAGKTCDLKLERARRIEFLP
ncbi:MAG: tetratricopeptide repeat protein [Planctomycetes bacterium]|nr:tetratricopeptide repeat protein [Planctomycetota bacterium]